MSNGFEAENDGGLILRIGESVFVRNQGHDLKMWEALSRGDPSIIKGRR